MLESTSASLLPKGGHAISLCALWFIHHLFMSEKPVFFLSLFQIYYFFPPSGSDEFIRGAGRLVVGPRMPPPPPLSSRVSTERTPLRHHRRQPPNRAAEEPAAHRRTSLTQKHRVLHVREKREKKTRGETFHSHQYFRIVLFTRETAGWRWNYGM